MNIGKSLIVIGMVLVATSAVAVEQQDQGQIWVEQLRRQAEEQAQGQRTNEKLNNPRPGDRIPMNDHNKQDYYYYDGDRWNRHRDIWVDQESTGGKANGSTDESE